MKKLLFKQLSILCALFMITSSVNAQDLYLIIGQSNAAGRDLDFDVNGADKMTNDVRYLADDRGFLKGRQPLNKYSGIRKDLDIQGVNLGLEFGKEMHKHTDNRVYLVVNARGGTKIAQWRKTNTSYDYYEDTKTRVEQAESECGCSLKGIVWHQGEGNVNSTDGTFTSSYMASLEDFIAELRDDFGNVPFIVGQLLQVDKNLAFNNAMKTVDDNSFGTDNVEWATSINLTSYDGTHFDAASTRLLGKRYAKRMKQFIAEGRASQQAIIAEQVAGKKVNLTWIADEADAPTKYTLQHSTNGLDYTDLMTTTPIDKGDTEVYHDQHTTPSIGDNFYRVKVDYADDASTFIENARVSFTASAIPAFPNPAADVVYVDLSKIMGNSAVISLFNNQGVEMKNLVLDADHGKVISMDISEFQNGLYSLQIKPNNLKAITQQLMISDSY